MTKHKLQLIALEETLCKHFRINAKDVTYIELLEMNYIFSFAQEHLQSSELVDILAEVTRLQKALKSQSRSKRRKLYELFWKCKHTNMVESKRYSTDTKKLPTRQNRGNYY